VLPTNSNAVRTILKLLIIDLLLEVKVLTNWRKKCRSEWRIRRGIAVEQWMQRFSGLRKCILGVWGDHTLAAPFTRHIRFLEDLVNSKKRFDRPLLFHKYAHAGIHQTNLPGVELGHGVISSLDSAESGYYVIFSRRQIGNFYEEC
jgi:hypothetical protein